MQTKLLGCCLGGWLLLGSLALAQTPATAMPSDSAPAPGDGDSVHPMPFGDDDHAGGRDAPVFWIGADGLLWWIRQGPLPVALLASNATTPNPSLATRGTQVLFGGGSSKGLDFGALPGGRITSGFWIDPDHILGMDGSVFLLPKKSINYTAASSGTGAPFIGVPLNSAAFLNDAALGSNPGTPFGPTSVTLSSGTGVPFTFPGSTATFGPSTFHVSASTQLYGGDVNFIYSLLADDCGCWQFLVGYRNLSLKESLGLNIASTDPTLGTTAISVSDSFSTQNNFNGAQVGTRLSFVYERWLFEGTFKLGLGNMSSSLSVNGSTTFFTNSLGLPVGTSPGGIFALPSNIGSYHVSTFTAIPDFQLQTCYTMNQHVSCSFGLDAMYVSSVLRPGNQINPTIDPNQSALLVGLYNATGGAGTVLSPGVGGPFQPLVPLKRSDFFAAGLHLGLEFRY